MGKGATSRAGTDPPPQEGQPWNEWQVPPALPVT